MNPEFWRGRRVFMTGHTGFKGSWLTLWLRQAGAHVYGYAIPPPTEPNLFTEASVIDALASHSIGDIRDAESVARTMKAAAPEIVIHMAAQSLVRLSYASPLETYSTNVMGTANVLEAARQCEDVRVVLNVTTDKCYENKEWIWGYRETEPLGGRDPYSSSKACSELVTSAYRESFLKSANIAVASGRAGNVIGGGDWAADRLVPDFFRAADVGDTLDVRYPNATRPWQHVLEPLSGYLLLAEQLAVVGQACAGGWNFGPSDDDTKTVRWILDGLVTRVPGASWRSMGGAHAHEAGLLRLDSTKARNELGWRPRWSVDKALDMTVRWHEAWKSGGDMTAVCLAQIAQHQTSEQSGSA